jgi:hypothetical protein
MFDDYTPRDWRRIRFIIDCVLIVGLIAVIVLAIGSIAQQTP